MNKIEHICFFVPNYPTNNDPVYTFVREVVCEIANLGIKCSVIAPQSITNFTIKRQRKRPLFWQDKSDKNYKIDVYQPITAHFFKFKILGSSFSALLTEWAMKRAFKKLKDRPDVLYAHFWHSAVIAGSVGDKHNIPVFVASGESEIWVNRLYKKDKICNNIKNIKSVISVSTKNMQESIDLDLAVKEKIEVIPNSINKKLFYPMNKNQAREELSFNKNDFIVAYTGAFTHRKGVLRLSEALKNLPDTKSIFIGSGNLKPDNDDILFMGRLPHNQLVTYLNAADVFVLPTIAEGSSNAIIEAMACGLPIISSDLPFNDDILNEKYSLRIDSENIEQISDAISYLYENPEIRKEMSLASIKTSKDYDIDSRVNKIISLLENQI